MRKNTAYQLIAIVFMIMNLAASAFFVAGCGSNHSVASYTVTYSANGATSGDAPTDNTRYQPDLSVTVLGNIGNLQKAGYVFAGWNTEQSGTGTNYTAGQKFSIQSSNAVLFACWTDNTTTYTVTYNGNGNTGGSVPTDSNQYKAGHSVTVLGNTSELVKTGYVFAGWNTKADGTGIVYTQADVFAMGLANVILYANWKQGVITYTVTYEGNGETSGSVPVDTTHYETGYSVTVLSNSGSLEKAGYTFIGWNTQSDGGGINYSYGQEFTMGSANVILYARWSANPSIYSVAYDSNGATSGNPPTDPTRYVSGQSASVLGNIGNLEKTGYSFVGWNTAADGSGSTYTAGNALTIGSSNVILYAKWQGDNSYTVTYDGNGSTGGSAPTDESTYQPGYTVTVLGNSGDLVKSEYVFAGWNTRADGKGTVYTQNDNFAMGMADITLYANWSLNTTHTVSYDANGATAGEAPVDTTHYEVGYSVTVFGNTGDLSKTGKTFAGWNTAADGSGVNYTFGQEFTMGVTDVILYAKWVETATYNVTYAGNGNTSGNPPIDSTNYENGQPVTVLGNSGNLERAGYRFSDWNTRSDGYGDNYSQGSTFEMSSSNVTLFAKWTTIIYTVTFNSNGGSSVPSQGCLYLDTVSKPTDPTKTGNTFAGWFEDAGCTDPWYFNRDRVTQNMTLFAKWTSNQYTVVFDSQGGSHVSPETVTHGNKAVRPANPTKTGYTFTGWFKDQKCTESWVFESDRVNSNVVLYAGWTVTYHTVTFNVNGGSAVTPQSIRYGAKASMPARPTKGNYALAGWYRDVALTNQWTFTTTAVTADVTLYAKWATYTLGSRGPAGGWVFYDAGSYSGGTWRYLEAAPSDYSNTIPWGAEELTLAGGYDLGRGNDNTSTIIDKFGNSYLYGARVCRELVVGDYSDWSLPSADELDYMRERLYLEGKGGFLNAYYWSSTEDNQLRAYAFMFSGSAPGGKKLNKNLPYRVRAIRYF